MNKPTGRDYVTVTYNEAEFFTFIGCFELLAALNFHDAVDIMLMAENSTDFRDNRREAQ